MRPVVETAGCQMTWIVMNNVGDGDVDVGDVVGGVLGGAANSDVDVAVDVNDTVDSFNAG